MKHFYSPSTGGFYIEGIHSVMPEDVFEISEEQHRALIEGQSLGKQIVYKSRKLQLVTPAAMVKTWEDIRATRDRLLGDCDWTQMPDNNLDADVKAKWTVYRQKLRDITTAFEDADEVVWPMNPTTEE